MRKIIFLLLLLIFIFFPVFFVKGVVKLENPLKAKDFKEFIDRIITILFYLGIVIAPLMIVLAAFFFLTAGGDPQKIQTAQNIILYTCIGILIIFIAKIFIALIRKVLEAK